MPIRLNRIYTRTGDKGMTGLVGGKRVPKTSTRIEAYGTVDELNSTIGLVRTFLPEYRERLGAEYKWYFEMLRRVQNELFDVGSELATPPEVAYEGMHRMGPREVEKLEEEMDRMERELEPLKTFVLPGGGVLNAYLHLARTVSRRAERVCWVLNETEPVNEHLLAYLNRLADHLFVESRWVSKRLGDAEFLWDRGLRIDARRAAKKKTHPSHS
jgi:cob(I)alamin adenosyltransferase